MTEKYLMLNLITEEFEIVESWNNMINTFDEDIEFISEVEAHPKEENYCHFAKLMFNELNEREQNLIKRKYPEFLI